MKNIVLNWLKFLYENYCWKKFCKKTFLEWKIS